MAYRNDYEQLLRDIQSSGQNWSDYDLQLAREDPDVGRSLFTQKQNYANAQTDAERRAANSAAEMLRAQYGGYTGGSDGTGYMKAPTVAKSDKTPNYAPAYTEYVSKYADQIDSLLGEIMNREPFSYSPNTDPTFQAYAEKYRNLGNQSRKNVMGEAAAMTGGMPNSFAIAASQQAQDGHNAQLTDAIPALKQLAYDMYLGDIDQKRADLSSMMGLDEMYYGRHQDSYNNQLNQWQANYNVDRDLISDARYENETEYDRAMDRAALLAQAGDYSGYAALGYSADQIAALQAAAVKPPKVKATTEDNRLDDTEYFGADFDYSDAKEALKKKGLSASGLLTESQWEAKAANPAPGDGAAVDNYMNYADYLKDYVEYMTQNK